MSPATFTPLSGTIPWLAMYGDDSASVNEKYKYILAYEEDSAGTDYVQTDGEVESHHKKC